MPDGRAQRLLGPLMRAPRDRTPRRASARPLPRADESLRADLEERLRFEALLADLSAQFVHRPAGEVDGLYPTGLIRWRYSRLKARPLLRLWVEHLALDDTVAADAQTFADRIVGVGLAIFGAGAAFEKHAGSLPRAGVPPARG